MKIILKSSICAVLLFFLYSLSSAQEMSWNVINKAGRTFENCVLDSLTDSHLYITCNSSSYWMQLDSITAITSNRKSNFWVGAGIGALTGFAAGAIIGYTQRSASCNRGSPECEIWPPSVNAFVVGSIFTIPCALLGGIFGALSGKEEVYEFSIMSREDKIRVIRNLISRSE